MKSLKIFPLALAALLAGCHANDRPYDATGIFEATEVTVSAEQNGRLMLFDVHEGDTVQAGQQVGLIDTVQLALQARQLGATSAAIANQKPNVNTQLAALNEQLNKARQEVKRYEKLVREGAVNRKALDDARSAANVLQRQISAQSANLGSSNRTLTAQAGANDIARMQVLNQLEKCHIISPVRGTVLQKYAQQGELAGAGRPLFKVADTQNIFLRAYLTTAQLEKVKLGQPVTVFADYGDDNRKEYKGKIIWISSRAEFTPKTILTNDERADQVYAVKVAVQNDGYIKIGMYGEMKL